MSPTVDPRIAHLIDIIDVQGAEYELDSVQWFDPEQAAGTHHIFVDILDKSGKRAVGTKVTVSWRDGYTTGQIEEKPGEPWGFNFAMYATFGSYSVMVGEPGQELRYSDSVHKLGLGTPEEPDVKHHTSFGLRFHHSEMVIEDQPPKAIAAIPTRVELGETATFDGSQSEAGSHPIVTYMWDFGDGVYRGGQTTTHLYTELGTYEVSLTVTDEAGLSNSTYPVPISVVPEVPEPEPEWPPEWQELFDYLSSIQHTLDLIHEALVA